jgi:hypothetical protein
MVTSPEIASIFETACHGFEPVPSDKYDFVSSLGVSYVGTSGGLKLYKDPLFPSSQILLGHKGNHPYDSGYFMCPLRLIKQGATVLNPDTFNPYKPLFGVYATYMPPEGSKYYGRISVVNFII